ncbi:1-deoxy-D-xylulose-5-phosphate reductoisomerase [Shimazuella sp. AN120528]|uniref:1-deoxy-D-xylulose-5-phosphate reductoisomerase n=1 Tax=Shimazuella soli TaxID=1892854 RepID=UPI001F0F4811|nr:1-deoxy-D-xylulose-5-phosphate reductoisomerase [Shimazuella soli]MCH5586243.1 1-deoxy-D-xylulose-5-phosphate reductoisomerase [Shimazuella soli]
MLEKLSILGSTGSIGTSTLDVVKQHPDQFQVIALAAGSNVEKMIHQVQLFRPKLISMSTKDLAERVAREIPDSIKVVWGDKGLLEVATHPESTYVVSSLVGSRGLEPTLAAIEAGKRIGLANKESLVTAGHLVMDLAKKHKVDILPIDSEHSALFQCLNGERREDVKKLILTASGGAFRDFSREQLTDATPEMALKHPNWAMGAKVTIDTATLMNKGLEVMEAHWLFSFPYEQIDVLVHPQSIIHSMVEFQDGAVIAQLGTPDMKVPIQYALSYPKRLPLAMPALSLSEIGQLTFGKPDYSRFPCLAMAFEAGKAGGTMPTVLNAANEIAVEKFLNKSIPFLGIEAMIERTLEKHVSINNPQLEDIQHADQWAREFARQLTL